MTDSAFVYPVDTRPPRHFWRRAVAFFVDNWTFQLTLILAMLLIYSAAGWNFGFSTSISCELAKDGPLVRQVETEWPLTAGQMRFNQVCTFGSGDGQERMFTSIVTGRDTALGSELPLRQFSIGIDEAGNAIPPTMLAKTFQFLQPLLVWGLFVFGTAWLTANGRRTPGKLLMSLRIVDEAGAVPSLKRCLTREVWKFLPVGVAGIAVALLATLPFGSSLFSGDVVDLIGAARDVQVTDFLTLLTLGFVAWIIGFVWWFGPFFVWRGQNFHDRIAGCFVVRATAKI